MSRAAIAALGSAPPPWRERVDPGRKNGLRRGGAPRLSGCCTSLEAAAVGCTCPPKCTRTSGGDGERCVRRPSSSLLRTALFFSAVRGRGEHCPSVEPPLGCSPPFFKTADLAFLWTVKRAYCHFWLSRTFQPAPAGVGQLPSPTDKRRACACVCCRAARAFEHPHSSSPTTAARHRFTAQRRSPPDCVRPRPGRRRNAIWERSCAFSPWARGHSRAACHHSLSTALACVAHGRVGPKCQTACGGRVRVAFSSCVCCLPAWMAERARVCVCGGGPHLACIHPSSSQRPPPLAHRPNHPLSRTDMSQCHPFDCARTAGARMARFRDVSTLNTCGQRGGTANRFIGRRHPILRAAATLPPPRRGQARTAVFGRVGDSPPVSSRFRCFLTLLGEISPPSAPLPRPRSPWGGTPCHTSPRMDQVR